MTHFILLAVAFAALVPQVQEHPLVGAWRITYPGDLRVRNGVLDPVFLTGTLTVERTGDSLIANLVSDPSADLPARPPLRLATAAGPGDAVFESRSQATVNRGGGAETVTSVSTWTFGVRGDSLVATMERRLEGANARSFGAQPVTGVRVRT